MAGLAPTPASTDKRTLVDFRRGPLGPYFDGFAAYLKARGYNATARTILGKCCQFNAFLIERGISHCREVPQVFADAFLAAYHDPALAVGSKYVPSGEARRALSHLFDYLAQQEGLKRPKARPIINPYTWVLEPYLRYLARERELSARSIKYHHRQLLELFLDTLGSQVRRERFKQLQAAVVESCVRAHVRTSTAHRGTLATILRDFFRYCADRRYTRADFSGLIPTVRRYHHAALPKGKEDNALEAMLRTIPNDTAIGARDHAMVLLMMAYGMRGISVAELLLNDLDCPTPASAFAPRRAGRKSCCRFSTPW